MPQDGNIGASFLDEIEAEAIVNEYFNYIEDIGLSLNPDKVRSMDSPASMLDIGEIVERITKRLEDSYC